MQGKKLVKNLLALALVFSTWGIFGFHSGDIEQAAPQQADAAADRDIDAVIDTAALPQIGMADIPPEPAAEPRYNVVAEVNTRKQTMTVRRDGEVLYVWKISSGRAGYRTPGGTYRPERMHTMWHSKAYDNAPMPYAIFFHNGYAIHGTTAVGRLGTAASHGCVRLATENAKKFFSLVSSVGVNRTQIIVSN